MASETTVRNNIDEAMKVIFSDPLVVNIVEDTELMSIFQTDMNVQNDSTTGGRYIEMAHYFQLPAGVGARLENEYIPEADDPVFKNSRLYLKKIQGTVEMSGDTMRRVVGDEGAFINYMERALPDLVTRLVNEIDRMYIGYGFGIKAKAGAISQPGGAATATLVVSMDRAHGVDGNTDAFLQFMEGESVVYLDPASGDFDQDDIVVDAGIRACKVTDIDEDNSQITLVCGSADLADAIVAVGVGGAWVPGDDAGFSGVAGAGFSSDVETSIREIQGLYAGCDDGGIRDLYNNIQRSLDGNRLWRSIVIDGGDAVWGGQLTEELLVFADDEVAVKGAGYIDTVISSRAACRGYWQSLKGDRVMNDPRGSYTGGKGGVDIILGDRTVKLKVARKMPPEVTFCLQKDTWRRLTLNQWEWDDRTGSIWNRVTDGVGRKDAFYATGLMYEELFNTAPRKNVRIDNLAANF